MATIKRKCDFCNRGYEADTRNINRGWGLCCSKSCAAKKRERNKPSYDSERVKENNYKRANWWNDDNSEDNRGHFRGYTSEGYRVYGRTAYDEFDEPMYDTDLIDMEQHPFDMD